MSFESFYGGRMGASFIIRKRFDGIDIPNDTIRRKKIYATNGNIDNLIYYVDINNKLIEKNSNNYNNPNFRWQYVELDGSELSNVEWDPNLTGTSGAPVAVTLASEYAEGMIQCFSQGGDSTDEVNYGEYIIIDTHFGLCRRDDPDNGKVFRRGIDFQGNLAGAEYVGQIIGPQGESTDLTIDTYDDVMVHAGASHGEYNPINDSVVPGKYIDPNTGLPAYHDEISYAWYNLRDEYGNIDTAVIGFKFPYTVFEWTGEQRSAYYEVGDVIPIGKTVGDRIPDDGMELIERIDDASHPYFEKWRIKLPHGIKGDTLEDLEIYPTMAKAGSAIYEDSECTTLTGQTVGGSGLPLDYLNNEASNISCPLVNGTGYIRFQDGEVFNIRYKQYNYDSRVEGESHYVDLGEYNMIDDIDLAEDGTVTITYTNHEAKVFTKVIQWITDIHMGEDGHFGVHYNTNDISDPFQEGYYDYSSVLKNITDVRINTGTVEGSGTQNVEVEYSDDGVYHTIGQPLNYILDTYVVPMSSTSGYAGHLLVYYSDPVRRNASLIKNLIFFSARLNQNVTGWTDLGDIKGITQTPLTFAEYNSFSDIPDNPPEVIMGSVSEPNNKYAGWGALYTNGGSLWVAQYDYINGEWKTGVPYGEGLSDPSQVINFAPEIGSDSLATNGFQVERVLRVAASESMEVSEVITDFSRKEFDSLGRPVFNTSPIGPEVRYVGSQRNSGVNNLEEQLILGTGFNSTTSYSEDGNTIIEETDTVYKNNDAEENYYILHTAVTKEKTCYIDENNSHKLIINLRPRTLGDSSDVLEFNSNNIDTPIATKVQTYTYENGQKQVISTVQ